MNLFSSLTGNGNASTGRTGLKAGKMIREGNKLKPDLRKGEITVKSESDGLTHFYWKPRGASVEDDLIVFPGEAKLERVSQCTDGRVYLLKFENGSPTHFFWLQTKSDKQDDEAVKKVWPILRT